MAFFDIGDKDDPESCIWIIHYRVGINSSGIAGADWLECDQYFSIEHVVSDSLTYLGTA